MVPGTSRPAWPSLGFGAAGSCAAIGAARRCRGAVFEVASAAGGSAAYPQQSVRRWRRQRMSHSRLPVRRHRGFLPLPDDGRPPAGCACTPSGHRQPLALVARGAVQGHLSSGQVDGASVVVRSEKAWPLSAVRPSRHRAATRPPVRWVSKVWMETLCGRALELGAQVLRRPGALTLVIDRHGAVCGLVVRLDGAPRSCVRVRA
ncbi:hypothetical protein SSTU70S_00696 [Stutzerimonas stutzeri]